MPAIDVYLMYCALKAHFKGDYDYHKFSGRTKIKRESFYKRKDYEKKFHCNDYCFFWNYYNVKQCSYPFLKDEGLFLYQFYLQRL